LHCHTCALALHSAPHLPLFDAVENVLLAFRKNGIRALGNVRYGRDDESKVFLLMREAYEREVARESAS
jgi:hypothetical protein